MGAQLDKLSKARAGPMTSTALTLDRELPERLEWLCLDASRLWGAIALIGGAGTKLFENRSGEGPRLCARLPQSLEGDVLDPDGPRSRATARLRAGRTVSIEKMRAGAGGLAVSQADRGAAIDARARARARARTKRGSGAMIRTCSSKACTWGSSAVVERGFEHAAPVAASGRKVAAEWTSCKERIRSFNHWRQRATFVY